MKRRATERRSIQRPSAGRDMTKIILAKLENIATLHVTFTTFYLTSFSGMLWRARLFSSRSWLRGRNGLGRKRPAAFYGREEAARLFGHVQREERRQPLMVWEESSRRPFPYAHERRKYKGTGPVQERKFRHMIYSDFARRMSAETLFTYGSGFFYYYVSQHVSCCCTYSRSSWSPIAILIVIAAAAATKSEVDFVCVGRNAFFDSYAGQ